MDHMTNDSWQALIAVLWPFLQQQWKNSNSPIFRWVTAETHKVNLMLSGIVAVLTTAGFHFMGSLADGGTLTIPPIASLGHVAAQMFMQHFVYHAVISGPDIQKQILGELKKSNENAKTA